MVELHSAHGYLLSSFLTPVMNHRTDDTAARSRTGCASRFGCSPPCAPPGRRTSRCRCASRPPTGSTRRPVAGGFGRHRPRLRRGRRRPDRRLGGLDHARRQAGLRPHVPDPLLRPHPQRGPAWRPWPSATSTSPTTSTRSWPPAAPTCAAWPGRIWPIPTGPGTPPPQLAHAGRGGRCSTRRPRPALPQRGEAAAGGRQGMNGRHAVVTGAGSGIGARHRRGAAGGRLPGHRARLATRPSSRPLEPAVATSPPSPATSPTPAAVAAASRSRPLRLRRHPDQQRRRAPRPRPSRDTGDDLSSHAGAQSDQRRARSRDWSCPACASAAGAGSSTSPAPRA